MTANVTIESLEQEMKSLKELNQEILRKLYRTQGENIQFLAQLRREREKLIEGLGHVNWEQHEETCPAHRACTCHKEFKESVVKHAREQDFKSINQYSKPINTVDKGFSHQNFP